MDALIRALERFSLAIDRIAALFLAAITLLVVASAIGRYGFASPIPEAFDISRLMLGVAIMWGFASVGFRGSHIKVDIFVELMPPLLRRIVDLIAWTALLIFTVLLSWKMFDRVASAFRSGEATFDLRLPAWPFLALICAGAAVAIFTALARIVIIAAGRGSLDHFDAAEQAARSGRTDVEG